MGGAGQTPSPRGRLTMGLRVLRGLLHGPTPWHGLRKAGGVQEGTRGQARASPAGWHLEECGVGAV